MFRTIGKRLYKNRAKIAVTALIPKNGSEPFQDVQEIRDIPGLGIALLLQRQDRHGQLG